MGRTMLFSEILPKLNSGELYRRASWPKNDFVYLVPGSTFPVNRKPLLGIFPEGTQISYAPHIDYLHVETNTASVWTPTQEDLFGLDWTKTFLGGQTALPLEQGAATQPAMPVWETHTVWVPDYADLISEPERSRARSEAVSGLKWLHKQCFADSNPALAAFLYAFEHNMIGDKSKVLQDAEFTKSLFSDIAKHALFKRTATKNVQLKIPDVTKETKGCPNVFIAGSFSLLSGLDPIDQKFLQAVFVRTFALTYSRITAHLEKLLNIRIRADKYPTPVPPATSEMVLLPEEQDALAEASPFRVNIDDYIAPAAISTGIPATLKQWCQSNKVPEEFKVSESLKYEQS